MTAEAEAGLWVFVEPCRNYPVWPFKTAQSIMYMETRLGGPHGIPLTPSSGAGIKKEVW